MKKSILLGFFMAVCLTISAQQVQTCGYCRGNGGVICRNCGGNGQVTMYNPYYGYIKQVCGVCRGYRAVVCHNCQGRKYIPIFKGKEKKDEYEQVLVKVKGCNGFAGSLCSCKEYKGFKQRGTNSYSGACSNYAGGHKCGHGPEAHYQ